MSPKILRRCDICKKFHASYIVPDSGGGKKYTCYDCWKAYHEPAAAGPVPLTEEENKKDEDPFT